MAEITAEQFKDAARKAVAAGDLETARSLIARARAVEASSTNLAEQTGSGINEGMSALFGAPAAMFDASSDLITKGINRALGTDLKTTEDLPPQLQNRIGTTQRYENAFRDLGVISDTPPQTRLQEFGRRAGFETGASAPLGLLAGPGALLVDMFGNLGAAGGGQVSSEVFPDNPVAEDTARLLGGIGGGLLGARVSGGRTRAKAGRDYVKNAPSSETLSEAAKRKYTEGHNLGIKIKPTATKLLDAEIRGIAKDNGLITPTGKIVENADIKQALALLDDYVAGPVTTKQMQALRRRLSAIAGSPDKTISRVGVLMKKAYDDFLGGFAPQFKEGNELNTRAMRGEMMDRAEELADVRASQFSQSGPENALRTEYRALDRNIVKGKTKGLRPDQVKAVQDVSRGTPATNAARRVGKMAPKGPVSSGFNLGVGGLATALTQNPLLGILAGTTTSTAGLLGQGLANSLQRGASSRASAAMRQAVPLTLPPKMDSFQGLLAMMAGQGATQGR